MANFSSIMKMSLLSAFFIGSVSAQISSSQAQHLSADDYFKKGCQDEANALHAEAIADYDNAIKENPQHWKSYGNRAASRFNVKDYNGALKDVETCLAHFPNNQILVQLRDNTKKALAESSTTTNADADAEARRRAANKMLLDAQLGGDMADPSTLILMQARRKGLMP
jgi:tetratricopeptide (TPR) repeat protein